ncbi:MAG: T9SS type A sorting domain-containing protein [Bacteroidetes bacterium]|nr:MAG: T9SS type A sorting domain-containing protein [Bacteroidota bacterium]
MTRRIVQLFLLTQSVFYSLFVFSQEESLGPAFVSPGQSEQTIYRSEASFDSTFIYSSDTLSLPFFDDFSSNHFQVYEADFGANGVTSVKLYRLLDLNDVPLPVNSKFTSQKTFRRVVDINELSFEDIELEADTIKVRDLSNYDLALSPAQEIVYPPFFIYDTVGVADEPDTIWMSEFEFVQDSATQFFAPIKDTNAFWLDHSAQHNYTNAINPWSLGVVTLDGSDENGFPYTFGSTTNDFNDVLTSKKIDMGTVDAADSVYFSFIFQAKGWNDVPENGDSLILEFYAPQQTQWIQRWSSSATTLNDFDRVHIPITESKYLQTGFQFRFRNYSGNAGAIDQFHIDYVHLRAFSGHQDTLFKDFAIVYPIKTLLKDYTQVPWEHYQNSSDNKMADQMEAVLRNGSNKSENNEDGTVSISYQGAPEGQFTLDKDILSGGVNYDIPQHTYFSYHNLTGGYEFDRSKTGDYQEFDVKMTAKAQFFHDANNDTTYYVQRFYDAYAYDDGSAEAAYGPTGVQSRLAYRFDPYEGDSLIGIRMRFVPSVNDVSNELFLLTVWDDNNGKPGNVIYEDDFLNPRSPSYVYDDSLGFTNYYFQDYQKVFIPGAFHVGWRQLEASRLNLGMDMNTDQSANIFFSVDNGQTWKNTSYAGALLMRPIFLSALNQQVQVSELDPIEESFKIYPNPVQNTLHIQILNSEFEGATLLDLNGRALRHILPGQTSVDLSNLQAGIYLIRDLKRRSSYKIVKY